MKNRVTGTYNDKKSDLKASMKMPEPHVSLEYCILKTIFTVHKLGKSSKGCLILRNSYSINVTVIDCNRITKAFSTGLFLC